MSKAKLRKKIRRLKRENLKLITQSHAAMARSGENYEAYLEVLGVIEQPRKLDG